MRCNSLCALLLTLLLTAPAYAKELSGQVVGITDGDTLTLLDAYNTQFKVRLAGIDAPESAMNWGHKAKTALAELTFRRQVIVLWDKTDRYGRTLGKVMVDGRDINLRLIDQGMAWHYKKYQNEQSSEDRDLYSRSEDDSRTQKKGLWNDPNPIPPWEWRRGGKAGSPRFTAH